MCVRKKLRRVYDGGIVGEGVWGVEHGWKWCERVDVIELVQ